LAWQLEHSKHVALYEHLAEQGKPTPLDSRPEFDQDCAWFIQMFNTLSGSRPIGFGGAGSIPFSEIIRYIEVFGCYIGVEEDVQILQTMDRTFLEQSRKESERANERTKQKHRTPGKR